MPHTIHIGEWIKRSNEDFYMLFVKAWIPFNAWYHKEIRPVAGKRDRDCIDYIAQHPNTYKNKILSFLNGTDRLSLQFQQELVDLHNALLRHTIPDNTAPINFKTTSIGDAPSLIEEDFYKSHYKIERTVHGSSFHYDIRLEDKATHAPKYSKHFNDWKLEDLETDPNFLRLSESLQNRLRDEFKKVCIKAPRNIILDAIDAADGAKKRPLNSIEYGGYEKQYFINDKDKIAQVLIQVIYALRCQIFHGSLNPSESNLEVYEHAYQIQRMLIKELN